MLAPRAPPIKIKKQQQQQQQQQPSNNSSNHCFKKSPIAITKAHIMQSKTDAIDNQMTFKMKCCAKVQDLRQRQEGDVFFYGNLRDPSNGSTLPKEINLISWKGGIWGGGSWEGGHKKLMKVSIGLHCYTPEGLNILHIPSREWIHIPPWDKENHLQNPILGGYVSSLEGNHGGLVQIIFLSFHGWWL